MEGKQRRTPRKPLYRVELRVEASRLSTVEAAAKAAFPGTVTVVRKIDPATSRGDRLDIAASSVQDAVSDVEELMGELQEWFDNLPEQFQSGEKGGELEEAIQALEEIKDQLESVDFSNVSFPSMM